MRLLKILKQPDAVAISIIIISILINILYVAYFKPRPTNVVKGIVKEATHINEDGGFYYQQLNVTTEEGKTVDVRANLASVNSRKVASEDIVLLYKILKEDHSELYQYKGVSRTDPLFWIFILFLVGLFITIGVDGIKYLFPFLVLLPFLISSLFTYLLGSVNQYLLSFALIGVVTLITSYIRLKDKKLSLSITFSVLVTLAFVFIVNLLLQKVTRIDELYFTDGYLLNLPIGQEDYIRLINLSVLFIAFGAVINSSMEVSTLIKRKKIVYNLKAFFVLLRKGTESAQRTTGREINNLFFVLFGSSLLIFFALSKISSSEQLWDSILMVQFILNFISASLAVILIAPVSSIVSSILVYKDEN